MSEAAPPTRESIAEAISVVSHRLRTPLSVIKGALEALADGDQGPVTAAQREYLRDALTNVERMAKLINSLLEVSVIEEGRLELHKEKTDLKELVQEIVSDMTPFAVAHNITLTYSATPLPLISIDRMKIRPTVYNLLSNAIRYSSGKGEVSVHLRRAGDSIEFTCKDNGIGIGAEEQKKIFQKFYRSPRVMEMEVEGNGLGLYIDKAIIEEHGGKIGFTSEEGKGSTFYFTLPIHTAS